MNLSFSSLALSYSIIYTNNRIVKIIILEKS